MKRFEDGIRGVTKAVTRNIFRQRKATIVVVEDSAADMVITTRHIMAWMKSERLKRQHVNIIKLTSAKMALSYIARLAYGIGCPDIVFLDRNLDPTTEAHVSGEVLANDFKIACPTCTTVMYEGDPPPKLILKRESQFFKIDKHLTKNAMSGSNIARCLSENLHIA